MYTIGRKWHRIETVGRKPLSKPEPYIGCSALSEEVRVDRIAIVELAQRKDVARIISPMFIIYTQILAC